MSDAKFEDGGDRPLRLKALDSDDLAVMSSLTQDAVFPASEMRWDRKARRFALLLNRFRWEDAPNAKIGKRSVERVQAMLSIEDVMSVKSQGVQAGDADTIMSLLSVSFEPSTDGMGRVLMTLSGDGAIAIEVEALEIMLADVTRPYIAPSKSVPQHGD
ncbi:MAG: DUF2948 family protein [Yoonia sp.]|jgi:hypothetical protein|tara:strand:+ start:1359 stop:1835 length:477 start_codon:yes stop_codon:yes gene_type:complete